MPFPLILSEIPAAPPAADVSLHPAERAVPPGVGPPLPPLPAEIGPAELPASAVPVGPRATELELTEPELTTEPGLTTEPELTTTTPELLEPAVSAGSPWLTSVDGLLPAIAQTAPLPAGGSWRDGAFPAWPAAPATGSAPGPAPGPASPNPPLLLEADQQEYDLADQVISAYGNVLIQFGDAQLSSNRLWVNLRNRFVQAEEEVLFTRNNQIIAGSFATYNLIQGAGTVLEAQGELALDDATRDFSTNFQVVGSSSQVLAPVDQTLRSEGSLSSVTSSGGLSLGTDSRVQAGTEGNNINRLRFEADRLDFDGSGWYAEGIRLTNDPFSPPEIEFRGDTARLTPLNAEEDELVITNARVVFDQGLSIPLLRSRIILRRGQVDPSELNPIPTAIGIDGRDRGGLYIERIFSIRPGGPWQISFVPQFYIQRWLNESGANLGNPANFGLTAGLSGSLGPRTSVTATANLSGLDLDNFSNRLRASVRGQQLIGDHTLNLEYSYRDRLFNGSLGFQDVQSSLGAVLLSPVVRLGSSQIDLTYQLSGQYVTAATDRPALIGPNNPSSLTSLFRFQASVALSRVFRLWQGEGLPPTQTEGLRYSPRPVVPFLQLATGLRSTATYYSSSDLQETLTADVRLEGQIGHFSRSFFDYTAFNVGYSRSLVGGASSPFLFDRNVDQNVLSGGIVQQIYGPFRAGFQTALNLDTGRFIETELIFEYSRRAYGLVLRYNPAQASGFLGFRLSDFDWVGRTSDFDTPSPNPGP
jgi:Protein of unknown function (DUF3769)